MRGGDKRWPCHGRTTRLAGRAGLGACNATVKGVNELASWLGRARSMHAYAWVMARRTPCLPPPRAATSAAPGDPSIRLSAASSACCVVPSWLVLCESELMLMASVRMYRPRPRAGACSTGHRRRGAVCHESVVAIDAAATLRRPRIRSFRVVDGWMPALLCSYLAPPDPGSSLPSRVCSLKKWHRNRSF